MRKPVGSRQQLIDSTRMTCASGPVDDPTRTVLGDAATSGITSTCVPSSAQAESSAIAMS